LAKEREEDFNFVLTRYANERMLYRISESEFSDQFVLKGATLIAIWHDQPHRPTKDIDFLGFCQPDIDTIKKIFSDVCMLDFEDGIQFDASAMNVDEIREGARYEGIRAKIPGALGNAKLMVQIDIGFGDSVTPEPKSMKIPVLLGFPEPTLKTYSVYSVVSEKYEAMCSLGEANSRMKDFYDLWYIAEHEELEEKILREAIRSTFKLRGSELSSTLIIFEEHFHKDKERQRMWSAFLKKNRLSEISFGAVLSVIKKMIDATSG
jgi:predicted nucleotidyltransferase component of viral defense system